MLSKQTEHLAAVLRIVLPHIVLPPALLLRLASPPPPLCGLKCQL